MAKETSPKIGTIRFTEKEKEIIAIGVDSDFFKLIERVYRPKRQTKIAVSCLNLAQDDKDLQYFKGQSSELDFFVRDMRRASDEYTKKQLDADTEGPDE